MARSGTGVMSIPYPDFVAGTVINDAHVDANNADIVSEITNSIPRDGQAAPTADIPFGNNKITGLKTGTAATDAANLGQVQAAAYRWATVGGTADAITLTATPAISAYAAGQEFTFIPTDNNTGATTIAVSGLTTKNLKKTVYGGTVSSLAADDIWSGSVITVVYDGTQFRIKDSILSDGSVTTDELSDDSVTTAKIDDGAVTAEKLASGVGTTPSGVIQIYAGATAPTGYLLCYGQAVSRTTYSDLFTAISTTYGTGDGSTTFNVPDIRGRVVAGQDDMGGTSANRLTGQTWGVNGDTLGGTGGLETHTLDVTEIPSHTHDLNGQSSDQTGTSVIELAATGTTTISTTATGGGAAHNNVQPTIILNYIIKT